MTPGTSGTKARTELLAAILGVGGLIAVVFGFAGSQYICQGFGPCNPPPDYGYAVSAAVAGFVLLISSAAIFASLFLARTRRDGRIEH